MSEKFWYLKKCDLFEQVSADRLRRVEQRCRVRKFSAKSPIYLPADAADAVLLLGKGRVKICGFTMDGKQSILTFIEPGELFGELSVVDPSRRDEYAEAVEDSQVILIPAEVMNQLVAEHPTVSLGITKLIGFRRRRIERRLKYLLFHSNRDRLTHLLLELAEQYGKVVPDGIELAIKISHQDLANIIGSTRETATLVLGELQHEGLLKRSRRKIILTDLDKLAQCVQTETPRLKPQIPDEISRADLLGHAGRNVP